MDALQAKANEIRIRLLEMIHTGKTGHTGGALSSTDILTTLYYHVLHVDPKNPGWEDRESFCPKQGPLREGLLCILADKGFFDKAIYRLSVNINPL